MVGQPLGYLRADARGMMACLNRELGKRPRRNRYLVKPEMAVRTRWLVTRPSTRKRIGSTRANCTLKFFEADVSPIRTTFTMRSCWGKYIVMARRISSHQLRGMLFSGIRERL